MANLTPFAQIQGSLPPLIPKPAEQQAPQTMVFAPVHAPTTHEAPDLTPLQGIPQAQMPSVFHPLTPQEEIERDDQAAYDKNRAKDLNPWGSEQNHPGVFGKIMHGLSVATGGPNRRAFVEQGQKAELQNAAAAENQDESLRAQQQSDLERDEAALETADAKEHPQSKTEKWTTLKLPTGDLLTGPNGKIIQQNDAGELRAVDLPEGAMVAPKPPAFKPGVIFNKNYPYGWTSPEGKQYTISDPDIPDEGKLAIGDALQAYLKTKGDVSGSRISGLALYTLSRMMHMGYADNPKILAAMGDFAHAAGINLGQQTIKLLSEVPENQPLSPETGEPIGTAMPEAPTVGTRNQAQTAARVLTEMPTIRDEVTNAASSLGPVRGRLLVGYLLGGVGSTGDPKLDRQLASLRSDLHMTAAAAARFHLNSVEAMKSFDALIQAGKNPAEAIQGTLDSIERWAKTAQKQERGHGEQEGTSLGDTTKPDGVYEMNGKRYRVKGKKVYAD